MASQQQDKRHPVVENQDLQRQKAEIGKHVLSALGQPRDLYALQVRQLWDDRFRVNVFVGPDIVSATVAHSYFLVADSDGKVIASNPMITKKY
jgi:hypothetical protein